jgi:hypothetical protein
MTEATPQSDTKKLYVTFVLDETGSMMSIKDDTIGGFNQYLETLKASSQETDFTLVKFDSNKTEKVCVAKPIADVLPLTPDTYNPGAMTPLIDAVMKSILATEQAVIAEDVNVAIVVLTDGYENASREYTRVQLAEKIKELTAKGWLFTFLGADMDAFAEAYQYGFASANTVSLGKTPENVNAAFVSAARATRSYGLSGQSSSASYTFEERKAMGEEDVIGKARQGSTPNSVRSLVDDLSFTNSPTPSIQGGGGDGQSS